MIIKDMKDEDVFPFIGDIVPLSFLNKEYLFDIMLYLTFSLPPSMYLLVSFLLIPPEGEKRIYMGYLDDLYAYATNLIRFFIGINNY